MKDRIKNLNKYSHIIYLLVMLALLGLFFTNDFGIVDIHKTSVIVAVGIDPAGEEVQVTAQIAVPQPSQSGENVQYTEVQGSGLTVADALNEINAKTGTYPKLLFCKLILLGEGCQKNELFKTLGCFYRRNFSELTALVAMCKGKAQEMLEMPANIAPENSLALQKVLSEELKKSANVSSVDLKKLAETNYSVSEACYMPYIEANVQGTSQSGGNGDDVGGESPDSSDGQQGGGSGGGSGEGGGQQSGQGGQSGGSPQSGGQQGGQTVEFTARKTAVFSGGKFAGILNEQQAFALNVLKNSVNLAIVPADAEGVHYTVGLKSTSGGVKLKVKDGVPEATFSFKAKAQIQGARVVLDPETAMHDDVVSPEVLRATEAELQRRMEDLIKTCAETNCDVLGIKDLLHKYNYKYFEAFKDDILTRMKVNFKIQIGSVS